MKSVICLTLLLLAPLVAAQCTSDAMCSNGDKCCKKAGQCFDADYQECCEGDKIGDIVNTNYQTCCNGTACNNFNQRCHTFKYMHGDEQHCSSIAWVHPAKGFMIIGIPIVFGLLSLVMLIGSCMAGKSRAPGEKLSALQWIIIILSWIMGLLGMLLLFSPSWYHGLFTVLLAAISASVAQTRSFIALGIAWGMQYLMILVYLNPYAPNVLLTYGEPGGVVGRLKANVQQSYVDSPSWCSGYYFGHWTHDQQFRDARIHDPLNPHFGYCSQEWVTTLFVAATINVAINLALEICTIVWMVICMVNSPLLAQFTGGRADYNKDHHHAYDGGQYYEESPPQAGGYGDWGPGVQPAGTY